MTADKAIRVAQHRSAAISVPDTGYGVPPPPRRSFPRGDPRPPQCWHPSPSRSVMRVEWDAPDLQLEGRCDQGPYRCLVPIDKPMTVHECQHHNFLVARRERPDEAG